MSRTPITFLFPLFFTWKSKHSTAKILLLDQILMSWNNHDLSYILVLKLILHEYNNGLSWYHTITWVIIKTWITIICYYPNAVIDSLNKPWEHSAIGGFRKGISCIVCLQTNTFSSSLNTITIVLTGRNSLIWR